MQVETEKTILLVENQAVVSLAIANILKDNGFKVFTAINGIEAINISKRNTSIDLILMAVDLGKGTDGLNAAQTILQDHNLPIVFITNHLEKELIKRFNKISPYGYVFKNAGEAGVISSINMAFKLFETNQKLKTEVFKRESIEKNLLESEEKFKKVVGDTNALLLNVDRHGHIIYLNDAVALTLGYPKNKLIGSFYLKLVYPEDRKHVHSLFVKQINGLIKNSETEFRYLRKDGTFGWLSFLTNQIYEKGKIVALNGVAQDITLRKQIEGELHKKEAHYRSIVENLNLAYYEANTRGVFTYCNVGFITSSGYSEKELLGKVSFNLIIEEHRADIIAKYKRAFKEKQPNLITEFKVKPKHRTEFWVEQITHFDYNEQGNCIKGNSIIRDIDERKRTEETLQKQEEILRQFFNVSFNAIFLISANWKFIRANDVAVKLYGYTRDELLDMTPVELAPQRLQDKVTRFLNIAIREKQNFEWIHITKRGIEFPVEIHTKPIVVDGSPCIFAEIRDITEHKKAEEVLRKNEEMFRQFFNYSFDAIFLVNENGKIFDANDVAATLYGYTHEEFCNMSPADLSPPELQEEAVERQRNLLDKKFNSEWIHAKKDGTKFPVEIHTKPIIIDGKPCIFGEVRDITERKRTEEALLQSELNYRRFYEEDLSGIFLSTIDSGIKSCNQAYVDMMEYDSVEELLKSNPITHYPQSRSRIEFLNLLRKERKLYNYEGELKTKSGKLINSLENIMGVFDDNDNLIEFRGYVNDITEIKNAQKVLKNAAAEKEALHRELLHRVKNSFNQLKIIVYLERLKLEDTKTSNVLENIETRIGTLAEMYSILNVSGVSEQINLGKYIEQITKSLKNSFVDNDKKLSITTTFTLVNTTPNTASSVGLIINELLTNSLKYAFPENKEGKISVTLKKINGNAEIEVIDNGIGLPNDFDLEKSSSMGLQLVNMLVTQLSGSITYKVKNGTRFKLIFPLSD